MNGPQNNVILISIYGWKGMGYMRKLFGHKKQYTDDDFDMEDFDTDFDAEETYGEEGDYEEAYNGEGYEDGAEYEEAYEDGAEDGVEYEEAYEDGAEDGVEYEEAYEDGAEDGVEYEEAYEDGAEDGVEYEEAYDGEGEYGVQLYDTNAAAAEYEPGEEYEPDGAYVDLDEAGEDYGDEYEEETDEEDEEDDDDDEPLPWSAMTDLNFFQKVWYSLVHMSAIDRVITTSGVLVLVLALVAGTIYVDNLTKKNKPASQPVASIGSSMDGIHVVGEDGLMAVADAEKARIDAANAIQEDEQKDYDENEYTKDVTVTMNTTSIEKDLKIKFVNSKTNKLIANVPFSVTVETPGKKTETWTDDDMDGIIYKTGITPGRYSVAMNALTDEKYKDYEISTAAKKVDVRKEIAYQQVDVSDEIKKESEVDSKKEDTMINDTEQESTLTDTVAWVESTKTVIEATYTAIDRKNVKDPMTSAKAGTYIRTAELNVSGFSLQAGESKKLVYSAGIGNVSFGQATYTNYDSSIISVGSDGTVTGLAAGTTNLKIIVEGTIQETDPSGNNASRTETFTGNCQISVTEKKVDVKSISLDNTSLTLAEGGVASLKANVAPNDAGNKAVTWTSSNADVATVDNNGTVTAKKEGTAQITVASVENPAITAVCTVTVMKKTDSRTLSLSQSNLSLAPNAKAEIKAIIGNSDAAGSKDGTLEYTLDKTDVASVSMGALKDGTATITVTGKKAGVAILTVKLKDSSLTAVCTITVQKNTLKLDKSTLSIMPGSKGTVTATAGSTTGTFSADTSDKNIATVKISETKKSSDGSSLTATVEVTGVKTGSATVTVNYTDNGFTQSQTFTVKVAAKEGKLTDTSNRQLYVLTSDNKYREATYADYYDANIKTFYIKTEGKIKYTGWQTIDGRLYFFDAAGNKVTGEQVIQGAKYNFASDGSLVTGSGSFGIDVSKWNGTIDWTAVKNSGVNYVIIRCGYRGSSTGALVEDPKFKANIQGANAAGLKVGVYFFSQAINKAEAVEEASMTIELIKKYKISYPVFLDVEGSNGRGDRIDKATRTDVIKAYCETVQNAGYTAGVYANKSWLNDKIDAGQLGKYKIWLAQYAATPTYTGRYDMWQYKSTGKISGISGNVDLNISYLGY